MKLLIKRLPSGDYEATFNLPTKTGGAITTSAVSPQKATALTAAGSLAHQLLNNPLVAGLLPPGTAVALQHVKDIGRAAAAGEHELRAAWDGLTHGGVKKALGSALRHLF